ncbi:MAG TPA: penicillin-binding protein 2 [Chromatiales bacterium]|nr:penicillin-binding protein 2 [Chromatiales bacterium]
MKPQAVDVVPWRRRLVLGLVALVVLGLGARAFFLQAYERAFLQSEADARHLRRVPLQAHRGAILDRSGEPLAVSTPVDSVWVDPKALFASGGTDGRPSAREQIARLARALGRDARALYQTLDARAQRRFVYVARHLPPERAAQVRALGVTGVYLQREYRRYYPSAEITAHVLGFTDIEDRGQEGLELAYDRWLRGIPGEKRVLRDRRGRVVADVAQVRAPQPGRDLTLSIDQRIQYLAYRALKRGVQRVGARGGSLVVIDPRTGEVLAMVNQPSFNPNNPADRRPGRTRNRAVTDVFEPGSTVKPFTIAAALASGRYDPDHVVDTSPGWWRISRHTIRDMHDYGPCSLGRILVKSSNIGAAKLALELPPEQLWGIFHQVGFGSGTDSGFPGEATGVLRDFQDWRRVEQATLAFGYGLSVTALQLARAYAVLATDGLLVPATFLRTDEPPTAERVLPARVARQVRRMLEGVVGAEGTAPRAAVTGYRVAGKTGTVHKSEAGGYAAKRYLALFAGMVPASRPALVAVVVIDEPVPKQHFGGQAAAPVFAEVMAGALRLLNVPPDAVEHLQAGRATREGPA